MMTIEPKNHYYNREIKYLDLYIIYWKIPSINNAHSQEHFEENLDAEYELESVDIINNHCIFT